MSLNVLHTIASLQLRAGGPSRSVTDLCNSLGQQGMDVSLLSMDTPHELADCVEPDHAVVKLLSAGGPILPFLNARYPANHLKVIRSLNACTPLQIVHDHGMWLPCNHATAIVARRLGVFRMVSPRGMLEPWALTFKAWKKKLAWQLWAYRDLQETRVFCATAQQEAENLRQLGFRQPIAVIPNGVDIPELPKPAIKKKNMRTALFLSRVHPKKGLINLVRAWSKIRTEDWQVLIAGPDEGGHRLEVEQEVHRHGLTDAFNFIGPVKDHDKWELYSSADLFVLPTHSENFGIVVAEALASGVPVITTKGTPWAELEEHNCGWWIDIGVEPLAKALEEAMSLSFEERQAMGQRGRRLVEQNYSWDKIGQEMVAVYEWVLGRRGVPECMMMD